MTWNGESQRHSLAKQGIRSFEYQPATFHNNNSLCTIPEHDAREDWKGVLAFIDDNWRLTDDEIIKVKMWVKDWEHDSDGMDVQRVLSNVSKNNDSFVTEKDGRLAKSMIYNTLYGHRVVHSHLYKYPDREHIGLLQDLNRSD
jgi:hypothetical protein